MNNKSLLTALLLFLYSALNSQHKTLPEITPSKYHLYKTTEKIMIDGNLEESVWSTTPSTEPFFNQWPLETGKAKIKTEVKITFDDTYLYFSFKTYQDKANTTTLSLKRDSPEANWLSDSVIILLDPINRKSNGFIFGVNSGSAQFEGLLSAQGGHTNTDSNWDNKWYSSAKVYENFWTAEIAIPFKSLRFNSTNKVWGINFVRADMQNNHFSTWSKVPINFDAQDMGYFGEMTFEELPKSKTSNISLIPYSAINHITNNETGTNNATIIDFGGDAKIALSSSLNLDLTLNPDFSNVDVDQQVINLTRFDIFFPERRNFFLENSDLFTSFGTSGISPFFSRRIGLDDSGKPITIIGGARLTGNLTESLRVGVLNVQTDRDNMFLPNNYFVGAFQKNIFGRSTIKGLLTNRVSTSKRDNDPYSYNRTAGIETEYLSNNGFLSVKGIFHKSFTNGNTADDDTFLGGHFSYNNGKIITSAGFYRVGQGYQSDLGFVPRLNHFNAETELPEKIGFWRLNPQISYLFRPKVKSWFNQQSIRLASFISNGLGRGKMDREFSLEYNALLSSTGFFLIGVKHIGINLFTPTRLIDSINFLPIGQYKFMEAYFNYTTDLRKDFRSGTNLTYGSFYTGTKLSLTQSLEYRFAPWINFGVNYSFNNVQLGDVYGQEKLHLIIPKFEVNFANNLFWTTFSQYNSQSDSVNINSRIQWRYNSMCDLFIVYSDNYDGNFINQNRGVVLKLTYWLNI
ncbi:DUF5916 domain-containing protein [Winogradskyella sp.]|uniref:carbohydrate binding family 9 domain-containing protein n=1 Tax=Winogradskyella sp. TaxID=1883156 RepID=UPI003BACEC85